MEVMLFFNTCVLTPWYTSSHLYDESVNSITIFLLVYSLRICDGVHLLKTLKSFVFVGLADVHQKKHALLTLGLPTVLESTFLRNF